jgi:hypothetical protein
MITVTDFGCGLHPVRELKYSGLEAKVMGDVVANLPSEGHCHTYICDQGHSHRLMVIMQVPYGLAAEELRGLARH